MLISSAGPICTTGVCCEGWGGISAGHNWEGEEIGGEDVFRGELRVGILKGLFDCLKEIATAEVQYWEETDMLGYTKIKVLTEYSIQHCHISDRAYIYIACIAYSCGH